LVAWLLGNLLVPPEECAGGIVFVIAENQSSFRLVGYEIKIRKVADALNVKRLQEIAFRVGLILCAGHDSIQFGEE